MMPRTSLLRLIASAALAAGGACAQTAVPQAWRAETSGAAWAIIGDTQAADNVRFEVRSGDRAAWDVAHAHSAERSELSDFAHKAPIGTDLWFAFGLTVEPGAPVTSKWLVIGQWHATEDPGTPAASPPWAQEFDAGDVFRIVVRSSSDNPLRSNPPPKVLFVDPVFQRGRTYRFVYQLRYSPTAGQLRAWRDGRLIVDYSGPLGYPTAQGPYFKFGIYREPAAEAIAVRYTGLRFGGPELRPR